MRMRVSVLLVLVSLTAACAGTQPLRPFESEGRFWPQPPDAKRIAFVGEFSSAADLGIHAGFWAKLANLVAGPKNEALVRPMAVAASDDGKLIYVADPDARCVHRYDLVRARYDCLTISRDRTLVSPVGLAVTGDGRLYVADSLLRGVFTVDRRGKWLEAWPLDIELVQPTGIAWDSEAGLLHVADTGAHAIRSFAPGGKLVRDVGERGDRPGQVNYPTYLWIDERRELVVTDSLNFRVQRFDRDGGFVSAFGHNGDTAGDFARPKGVAVDTLGHVYVVDALLHALQVFDRNGRLLLAIGEQGQSSGQFWLPNGIFITASNMIFVADSYNRRVQVFRYVGAES